MSPEQRLQSKYHSPDAGNSGNLGNSIDAENSGNPGKPGTPGTLGTPFIEIVLPSDPVAAQRFQDDIEALLLSYHAIDHDLFSVRLALEEALVNAIKHGNQMDRDKKVHVAYRLIEDRFEVQIADEGEGFDPTDVPDPTAEENRERPNGRGLLLMRHCMSEVIYNARGNSVCMAKVLRRGGS